jgi:hypothetical protein
MQLLKETIQANLPDKVQKVIILDTKSDNHEHDLKLYRIQYDYLIENSLFKDNTIIIVFNGIYNNLKDFEVDSDKKNLFVVHVGRDVYFELCLKETSLTVVWNLGCNATTLSYNKFQFKSHKHAKNQFDMITEFIKST